MNGNLRRTIEMAEKTDKTTVKCPREECGYVWNYSGNMAMASCPSCTYKCNVEDCKVKNIGDKDGD
ncbi:CxxC motif protein [Haloarcula virus Hardyhisp2]|uniref:CxxC motif protein n=1 Tax=Haloarcula virus Hardyhisp2 TaxID=2811386 RepID=A0A898KD35_9VIRU|nr:CxxC motif protein [Haloarcula virus Hardyhisp2]QSJ05036.1 CxxC motif protein [Haloarcula virus Hardyhisp2]